MNRSIKRHRQTLRDAATKPRPRTLNPVASVCIFLCFELRDRPWIGGDRLVAHSTKELAINH